MQLQFGCLLLLLASCVGEPVLKGGSRSPSSLQVEQRSAGPAPLKLLGPVFEALVASPDALQESVVFFCVDWMEQCKALQEDFRRTARAMADALNAQHLLEPQIRLAEVNCAEDKVLCNRQQVESYPSIVRYVAGAREQAWEGNLGRKYKDNLKAMQTWLQTHVGAQMEPRARPAEAPDEEMSSADAFRLAASAGSLIALTVVVIKSGMDMLRSTQMAVRVSRGISPEQDIKDQAKAEDAASTASSRMERRLPQEWVLEREKIEL